MRYQAVVVRVAVALLILVMSQPACAGGCHTPDVSSSQPFGGQCGLTCAGMFPYIAVEGIDVSIALTCGSTVMASAGGALCIVGNDIPTVQCDTFATPAPPYGTSCSCASSGFVLAGYCEC